MPASKSTAKRKTAAKKTAARKPRRKAKTRAAVKFGGRRLPMSVVPGELVGTTPDGRTWDPVACGVHRSGPLHESATDDHDEPAAGFDPKCEDCVTQAEATADHAHRQPQV